MKQRDAFDEAFIDDDTPEMRCDDWLLVGVAGIVVACGLLVLLAVWA